VADPIETVARITINLGPRAGAALHELMEMTGDNKTDAVNRAIQVYAYVQRVIETGGAILIREPGSEDAERLKIL
jgi:hypothetical protein